MALGNVTGFVNRLQPSGPVAKLKASGLGTLLNYVFAATKSK